MSEYKPITGELRKYATVSWDPWPDARDRLYQMCDRIDAIHAGLERENAELRERLAKMNEQSADMHGGGSSSITDELRNYTEEQIKWLDMTKVHYRKLFDIADRIDAEHEHQLEVLYRDMSDAEYVMLPKDADGEVWRVGDEIVDDGMVCEVVGIGPNRLYYYVDATDTVEWTQADSRRHHHAPTVEDVLREFADGIKDQNADFTELAIAEYSKRLQLKEDA